MNPSKKLNEIVLHFKIFNCLASLFAFSFKIYYFFWYFTIIFIGSELATSEPEIYC